MAEKLRLKTTGNKMRLRIHAVVLVLVILASLAVGFVAGQKGLFSMTAKTVDKNCIPQSDFQFFLDQYNGLQADYKKCVADVWALQLSYKTGKPATEPVAPKNTTNSTN